jgi:branched-chain amino acid transport system substrate-binding protein
MKKTYTFWTAFIFMVGCLTLGTQMIPAARAAEPIIFGGVIDHTGPTNTIGPFVSGGVNDYVKLINKKGGIDGHPIKIYERDHKYKVPLAVEAYEEYKQKGMLGFLSYGTPITYGLTPKYMADKIPGFTPGFGRADATDGRVWPYVFPIAATYWSQAGASVKFVLDQWKKEGKSGKPKIAYLYFDNPAGREPLPIFEKIQKVEGFQFKTWAIPSPGIEQGAQVLDIAKRYKADWVITHIFGRGPSVSIKEFKRIGFPLDRVISFVWGAAESDAIAAGWKTAQGYYGIQFAGVGADFPVNKEIIKMYGGKKPKAMDISVYYNRGILWVGIPIEGARLALQKFGYPLTGEKLRKGIEMIKDFTMGGLLPPLNITPADHEGGGWVKVYQVKGEKFVPVTDWFHGYRDLVQKAVAESAKK